MIARHRSTSPRRANRRASGVRIPALRLPALFVAIALVAMACAEAEPQTPAFSGDLSKGNPTAGEEVANEASGEAPEATQLSEVQSDQLDAAVQQSPAGCDLLDTTSCMLPFPSDALSVEDPASPTMRRVDLPEGQLVNAQGVPFDPTQWNQLDGFSPATPIITVVPGLDPERTDLPPVTDIAMSVTEKSATVIVDLDSGQLVPHWAELDSRATDPAERSLIIHPAVSLFETHRFGVGLRNLRGSDGLPIPAPIAFQVLRDNLITDNQQLNERRDDYDAVFNEMALAGVNRADLDLAWWFTVASSDSLAGNVLSMRGDAFGKLGGSAPPFTVDEVITADTPDEDVELQDGIAKVVKGTFDVPLYLESAEPGASMSFNDAGQPVQSGTFTAEYTCSVPETAVESGEAKPVVYGHGLLGSGGQAAASEVQAAAAAGNFIYCGTDAIGLAADDIGYVAKVLSDISLFPPVADRLQQGILNYLFLGRLMVNQAGLGSADEFMTGGTTMFNTEEAYYDGNSQGAIFGGAVTAVATDWTKALLGVGGMGYNILLNRSVDFDEYFVILRQAYPDPVEQQIIFGVLQMMWDRGETAGYVQHLTDRPYDLTAPHQVLMTVAFGDHQVANVAADNIARTLNIPVYTPILPEDASEVPDEQRFYGLDPIRGFPHSGSAMFYFYSGTLPPPDGNITPVMGPLYDEQCAGAAAEDDVACLDPHGDPRRQKQTAALREAFFQPDATVPDVCEENPCLAEPRSEFDY